MDENIPVDTTDVSGEAAIEAVKRGRLGFNDFRIQEWRGAVRSGCLPQLYDELARQSPGFMPLTLGAVLFFGSTASQVYFHVDSKPNMLGIFAVESDTPAISRA